MQLAEICRRLRISKEAGVVLVRLGVVQAAPGFVPRPGSGSWARRCLPPGDGITKADLFADYHARTGPARTLADFARFGEAGRWLLRMPAARPPKALFEEAMAFFGESGGLPSPSELASLIGTTEALSKQLLDEAYGEKRTTAPDIPQFYSPELRARLDQQLLERLPEPLRTAPGTYLCPRRGHADERPSDRVMRTLLSIEDDRIFLPTAAAVLHWKRLGRDDRRTYVNVLALRRLEMRLDRGADLSDPYVALALLESMLEPGWRTGRMEDREGLEAALAYRSVLDAVQELGEASPSLQQTLSAFSFVAPAGDRHFFKAIDAASALLRKKYVQNRQDRIEAILDNPLGLLLTARLRLQEHETIRDRCREKIDQVIASGKALTAPLPFAISYTARDVNSRFSRCDQTLLCRLWTWQLLENVLFERMGKDPEQLKYTWAVAERLSGRDAYVVEYVDVSPSIPGEHTLAPIVVQAMQDFVLDVSSSLNAVQLMRKREMCDRTGFNKAKSCTPSGVGTFVGSTRYLARKARNVLGITLIPIEEFTLGLRYAHAQLFIIADSGARPSEALQAPGDGKLYKAVPAAEGRIFKTYECVSKNELSISVLLHPDTFRHMVNLFEEVSDRWHNGGALPVIRPNLHLHERKIEAARYLFICDQRMINFSEIGILTRLLLYDWHQLRGHDVRHLFSSMARRGGVSREIRQMLLNHESPVTSDGYGPETATEIERQKMMLAGQREDRMAKIRRASEEPTSPEIVELDRSLRLAIKIEAFHRAEQQYGAAEEAMAEVTRLSEALSLAKLKASPEAGLLDVG
jgi:hypothetical protein